MWWMLFTAQHGSCSGEHLYNQNLTLTRLNLQK